MKTHAETLIVRTPGGGGRKSFVDVTEDVRAIVARSGIMTGIANIFICHTSASLVIQENADPRVLSDLARWFEKVAPRDASYEHDDEGPDDMPSHLRSAITKTSETIPIRRGTLALGTWQALYVFEHRDASHSRTLDITLLGV